MFVPLLVYDEQQENRRAQLNRRTDAGGVGARRANGVGGADAPSGGKQKGHGVGGADALQFYFK